MIAFAAMLLMAALAAWLISTGMAAAPRAYLRFACTLLAALAVAAIGSGALAQSVALLVCAVAPVTLAMAARSLAPGLALGVAALLGLAAALTGLAVLALVPMLIASAVLVAARGSAAKMWASALALAAGGACLATGDLPALMALLSAAVLGISLALRESRRAAVRPLCAARGRLYAARPAPGHATPAR